jgi:hypothetical protein
VRDNICIKVSRWLTFVVFSFLTLIYAHIARAESPNGFPYICSDGGVYSIRTASNKPSGITARGAWFELKAFCRASISSTYDCAHDKSRETSRCFNEFRAKDNARMQDGVLAVWPDKIRHSPAAGWFNLVQLPNDLNQKICASALRELDCIKPFSATARNEQMKCIYEKSGFANRATGRSCFMAISQKLDALALQQQRQLLNNQRNVAGR